MAYDPDKVKITAIEATGSMNEYVAKYKIFGNPVIERVSAITQADAIEIVKKNCGMVGWIPTDLIVNEA